MENPEIPETIQMERFIPVEIFPFLPKRQKFPVPFVWINSARLHVERERNIYRYFVNGTTQSSSCFRCQKNISTIGRKFFTEISLQMVSADRNENQENQKKENSRSRSRFFSSWDSQQQWQLANRPSSLRIRLHSLDSCFSLRASSPGRLGVGAKKLPLHLFFAQLVRQATVKHSNNSKNTKRRMTTAIWKTSLD